MTTKWTTTPPPDNGKYYPDRPNRYIVCQPRTNAEGYPEYDPTNIVFCGTHNQCFVYLHKNQNHSIDYGLKHGGWCWLHQYDPEEKPSEAPTQPA